MLLIFYPNRSLQLIFVIVVCHRQKLVLSLYEFCFIRISLSINILDSQLLISRNLLTKVEQPFSGLLRYLLHFGLLVKETREIHISGVGLKLFRKRVEFGRRCEVGYSHCYSLFFSL